MSNVNDFLPFCPTDTGTNLLDEADYTASADRVSGNKPGVASSALNNKALRQSSYIASQLAQYISNTLTADVLDNATPATLLAQIQNAFRPAGEVTIFGGATAPAGWLLCDGSSLLRAGYPALFAAIGVTFGSADGTHFNVPDLRGIFVRGVGTQTVGGIGYTGTLAAKDTDHFQGHFHGPSGATTGYFATGSGVSGFTSGSNVLTPTNTGGPVNDGSHDTPRTGYETYPANIGMTYMIKI